MKTVILAGGRGMRAYPFTEYLPKPMMPINGKPIIMHVLQLYLEQGYDDFIVSLGYNKDVIIDYFRDRNTNYNINLVDTGEETDTGGRIFNCRNLLADGTFMATYVDGISDVRLDDLLGFHRQHGGLVTITAVPLISQYGTLEIADDGRVLAFHEKPVLREHWINAGFFVMEPAVFDYWEGQSLEREVFPNLQRKGLLYTYRHEGFFKSVDTYKDQKELEVILASRTVTDKK